MSERYIEKPAETNTVEDLIAFLQTLPKDCRVSVCGVKEWGVVFDPEHNIVLLDDPETIRNLVDALMEMEIVKC